MKQKSNNIWLVLALIGVLILVSNYQYSVTTPTECQDANPALKTYFSTVPDFDIGLVSHYGVTLAGNSIIKTLGSSTYCTKEILQSCQVGTIPVVGAEAKGASWGTTIQCGSGMQCADQSKAYEPGCGEERRSLTASVSSCSSACAKTDELCKQLGGEWADTGGCGTWTNPWYGNVLTEPPCNFAKDHGQVNVAYECKRSFCNPPADQTVSYGCKPDPNYVPPTPCPASWRNYCGGNELRKSDGCAQDVWLETCQYGCNTATVACNPAPITAQCGWEGYKCVEGDVYQFDTVCNKQELVTSCQYGCLNGQCKSAPPIVTATATATPMPVITAIPTQPIPMYTPISAIPEAKSLNMNALLLIIGVGGIALWFLFGKQK